MVDSRISKFAKVLVNYSMRVKKGDLVYIEGSTVSEPLLREVYKETILAGANPILFPHFDGINEILFKLGTDEQISYINPLQYTFQS
ncbi:MAG: aminopeptidase protein [Clostridia bacterium]|nr:aminopeptidase protein [Clostridia bacterium]